jgi:predicted CxxxxCH...CXXCH cytochrome family protein
MFAPILPRAAIPALALVLAALAGCDVPRSLSPGRDPCVRCHGTEGAGNAAPPRAVAGATDVSDIRVGAHQAHLQAGTVRGPIACGECHVVPTSIRTHSGDPSPVFGTLATWNGAAPAFDRATGTCTGTYCHGATVPGGSLVDPVWTATDHAAIACDACHGDPPPLPHPQLAACNGCHPGTVKSDGTIDVAGGLHVNGAIDVAGTSCGLCHPVPPDTGAHRVHYSDVSSPPLAVYGDLRILEDYYPGGGPAYVFGCGHCHPLDPARHGYAEVTLSPAGAPAGSLRAANAADAAYDPAAGTCSGVSCHSYGKAGPLNEWVAGGTTAAVSGFRTTPAWTSGAQLGCDGCHSNPPRYASSGPGAADANMHLQLASDGWETGHFGGLPGPWHSSKHGGDWWGAPQDASAITCQTCHYETADPAATGPSGFSWLNTTGDYQIPGGALGYACGSCHVAGDPLAPTGAGGVLPLHHVNGRVDVVFDPRLSLPAAAYLPAAPFTPTRPIWVTDANPGVPAPADGIYEPDPIPPGTWPFTAPTLSMHLASARYDPATKTCTNVSCHLVQTSVQWGGPNGWEACGGCHGF